MIFEVGGDVMNEQRDPRTFAIIGAAMEVRREGVWVPRGGVPGGAGVGVYQAGHSGRKPI